MIDVEIISSRTTFALKLLKAIKSNITLTKRNLRASLCTAQQHPGKPPSWIDRLIRISTDQDFVYCRLDTVETGKYTRYNSGELSESDYCSGLQCPRRREKFGKEKAKGKGTVMSKVCTQRC